MTNDETMNQAIRCIMGACDQTCPFWLNGVCHGCQEVATDLKNIFKELEAYRAIGTIEKTKRFKRRKYISS